MNKKLVITMGLPGSGKSYVVDKHYSGFMVCDCDEFKRNHTKYNPDKPEKLHVWSKMMNHNWMKNVMDTGVNMVYDSTGTDIDYIAELTETAKSYGYNVEVCFISVSVETAIVRNNSRPRKVSNDIIIKKHGQLEQALELNSRLADSVNVVVNE